MRALLAAGADGVLPLRNGWTPLMLAAGARAGATASGTVASGRCTATSRSRRSTPTRKARSTRYGWPSRRGGDVNAL